LPPERIADAVNCGRYSFGDHSNLVSFAVCLPKILKADIARESLFRAVGGRGGRGAGQWKRAARHRDRAAHRGVLIAAADGRVRVERVEADGREAVTTEVLRPRERLEPARRRETGEERASAR
jgi:hypothetical protein